MRSCRRSITHFTTLGAELVELRLRKVGKETRVAYEGDDLSRRTKDLINTTQTIQLSNHFDCVYI
ncbi:MAG: hypothetical protein ACRD5E_11875 [Nitrososphaeraceae archaeon]